MNKVTTTTISPFVVSGIEKVELADAKGEKHTYWKKEILPFGKRKYKGEELDFSKINPACLQAFDEKAVDAVPFVLSMADNKHPETGEEIKVLEGDLAKLELSGAGSLFGYFDLTPDVVKKIEASNKKLGVSARIDIDYEREDIGKKYPYALRHVCATTAAHIKGMGGWDKVELSEDEKGNETLDLSTEVIEVTETKETGDDLVAVEIPKDQLNKLLGFLSDMEKADDIAKKLSEDEKGKGNSPIELSEEATKRIELAETAAKQAYVLAEAGQREAAQARWERRESELALAGVPPVMLTEAAKVLGLHKAVTLELSETDGTKTTVNATAVISALLDHAKGFVDLGEERGHSVTDAGSTKGDTEYEAFEKEFLANFKS